jgi:hypothetical protein
MNVCFQGRNRHEADIAECPVVTYDGHCRKVPGLRHDGSIKELRARIERARPEHISPPWSSPTRSHKRCASSSARCGAPVDC